MLSAVPGTEKALNKQQLLKLLLRCCHLYPFFPDPGGPESLYLTMISASLCPSPSSNGPKVYPHTTSEGRVGTRSQAH